jgi:hypothetical protein
MQMHEPEQWQQSGRDEQASQQYNEYSDNYTDRYEPEQQQKIFPQPEQRLPGTVLRIIAIILSSLGFFLSVAGIIVSALVLHYAHGHEGWLAGGVVGLVASILILIVCVAIFVIAVITLALRMRRVRTRRVYQRMRARV